MLAQNHAQPGIEPILNQEKTMINKLAIGTFAILLTNVALAGTPQPLGLTLGVSLGQALGAVLGVPLGSALSIADGGLLSVAAVTLLIGIRLVRRKQNR